MSTAVLQVINWLNRGGLETWLLEFIRISCSQGVDVSVCCKGADTGTLAATAIAHGAKVIHCPQGTLGPFSRTFQKQFRALLRHGRFDVVHSHLGDLSWPIVNIAAEEGVHRRVVTHHSARSIAEKMLRPYASANSKVALGLLPLEMYARRRSVRRATDILPCSDAVRRALFPEQGDPRVSVHHLGIDVNRFCPSEEKRRNVEDELGLSKEATRIINVGNTDTPKNQERIIEVAAILRDLGLKPEFLIVGFGPLLGRFRETVAERGLDNVRFLGERNDVSRLLEACDIALHPSTIEGLPVAVLEYQGAFLPVVGSTIPGVQEALAPENRSLSSDPGDPQGFAASICRLISNASQRLAIGRAGRAWVEKHFSLRSSVLSLLQRYTSEDNSPRQRRFQPQGSHSMTGFDGSSGNGA